MEGGGGREDFHPEESYDQMVLLTQLKHIGSLFFSIAILHRDKNNTNISLFVYKCGEVIIITHKW